MGGRGRGRVGGHRARHRPPPRRAAARCPRCWWWTLATRARSAGKLPWPHPPACTPACPATACSPCPIHGTRAPEIRTARSHAMTTHFARAHLRADFGPRKPSRPARPLRAPGALKRASAHRPAWAERLPPSHPLSCPNRSSLPWDFIIFWVVKRLHFGQPHHLRRAFTRWLGPPAGNKCRRGRGSIPRGGGAVSPPL